MFGLRFGVLGMALLLLSHFYTRLYALLALVLDLVLALAILFRACACPW